MKPYAYRVVVRKLSAARFSQVAQKGSQVKFARTEGGVTRTAVVPRHREVAPGTLRSILKQAGIDVAEFDGLWRAPQRVGGRALRDRSRRVGIDGQPCIRVVIPT